MRERLNIRDGQQGLRFKGKEQESTGNLRA